MKIVLTALLAGVLSAAAADTQAKTDRERAALLGPVKTVRSEAAEFTPGGGRPRRSPVQAVTYDARGNVVECADFGPDGSVSQRFVYTFDAQGRATGYEEYTGGLSTPRRHVYVLDDRGDRVEYKIVQPDDSAGEKLVYKYDARGRLAEELLHEHKGKLISRNVHEYDEAGRPVSQTRYDADGTVSSVARTSYDARGRPAERSRHDGEVLTYRIRYRYDSRGRLVEQETVGSVLESEVPPSEALAPGRVSYLYKGDERPREATFYAPDGSVRERVVFKYDSRGNWVGKTYFAPPAPGSKGEARRAEHRTITYF